jgi:hypothetical protein
MGVTNIDKSDQHCHTEGKEENMCFLRIPGSELVVRERASQGAARKEEHERESGLKKLVQIK